MVTYLNKLFTSRKKLEALSYFPDIVRQVELDTPAIRFGVVWLIRTGNICDMMYNKN